MMLRTFRNLMPLIAVSASLLVVACLGGKSADKVVNIAGIVAPLNGKTEFIGGLSRIQQQGWLDTALAKRGWKVHWIPVPPSVGGPVVNEGFAAKSIDMATYGDLPAVIAMGGGVDLKLVQAIGAGSNIYVAVGTGSTIRTLADLKGKRIALHRGRPWEAGFARYAQSQGLSLDDFKIVNMNAPAGTAALTSGKVDAVVLIQAEAYVLQDRGLARILWSTATSPESWKMSGGTFARTDFIKAHPDIVQTVVTALVREAQWESIDANRATVIDWGTRMGAPLHAVQQDVANTKLSWREHSSPLAHPDLTEHFDYIARYAAQTGVTGSKVDVSHLIDMRFVEKAIQDLHLQGWWSPAAVARDKPVPVGAISATGR